MNNTIAIGSDHRGFTLKEVIKNHLADNYLVSDEGPISSEQKVDYPDFAFKVARAVQSEKATFGILICNTGIGMSIAANRLPEIRAALCRSKEDAVLSREHNNANILVLGAKHLNEQTAIKLVDHFLHTEFNSDKHLSRVKKIETGAKDI